MPYINPLIIGLVIWVIWFLVIAALIAYLRRVFAEDKFRKQEIATKEKQQKDNIQPEITKIKSGINRFAPIDHHHIEKSDRWIDDNSTPVEIRELLPEHKKNVQDYNKWLEESEKIIKEDCKLAFQGKKFEKLKDRFVGFKIDWREGFEGTIIDRYKRYILGGNIELEQCKEEMVQHYGRGRKTDNGTDSLRDFVDSSGFYDVINELKKIQERPSIETFREARGRTLEIVEQIEVVLKK